MDRKEAILRIKDHMEHHRIGKYPHLKLKEALANSERWRNAYPTREAAEAALKRSTD